MSAAERPTTYAQLDAEEIDALTVVLRRGALNVRSEDESRHEAQARAVLASDWLADHVARASTADRERVAAVLALCDEAERPPLHSMIPLGCVRASEVRAALAAPASSVAAGQGEVDRG